MTRTSRSEAAAVPWIVLVASDGSAQARAAVRAAGVFPWPAATTAAGIVAQEPGPPGLRDRASAELDEGLRRLAADSERLLAARWPTAPVAIVRERPAEAIVVHARRLRARTVIVGCRGRGAVSRLLLGSVSRAVVKGADASVLVVKGRPRAFRSVVVGVDGSAHAGAAVSYLCELAPPRGAAVTVLRVVEPARMPTVALLPARVRTTLATQAHALRAEQLGAARKDVEAAAARLQTAGWRARGVVRLGIPVDAILAEVHARRADLLVVGAQGVGGVKRLLLGSVAERTLSRSPVSVLVVKGAESGRSSR